MKTVTINLYSFDELSKEAQEKSISEHHDFLMDVERCDYEENEIIENIQANGYLFFNDGTLAHCTTYEATGITEFHFYGQTITL